MLYVYNINLKIDGGSKEKTLFYSTVMKKNREYREYITIEIIPIIELLIFKISEFKHLYLLCLIYNLPI